MRTTYEYIDFVIHLDEDTQQVEGGRVTNFNWTVLHYGKEIAFGREADKGNAAGEAEDVCDDYLKQTNRFKINLLEDGSVISKDGEYLGTWGTDESDAIYEFTPDGAEDVLFSDPFMGVLCQKVLSWHDPEDSVGLLNK